MLFSFRSTINCYKSCSEVEWPVPWHFSNIPWQFWLKLLPHTFWCIAMQFQRLLLLFVASNSGKRYWDWTLPCIRAQIELSSTFVYDYKMSTSGSSAKNSHLTRGGQTTIMPMPVNRITSQCKIKLSQKYCPRINLQLWNFCHSFLQWMGIFSWLLCLSLIHIWRCRRAI